MKKRILVIKLSSLGDTLHALPAVAAIHDAWNASIDWCVQPAFAGLVEAFTCVSRVIRTPRPSDLSGYLRTLRALRREHYNLVLDFQGLLKSAIVARAPHADRVIGPSFAREGSSLFYTELAGPRNRQRHAIEECFDFLRKLEIPVPERPQFPLRLPEAEPDVWGPQVAREPGPRIALAPYSRWETKNWPAGHFSALLKQLYEQTHARLYLIGGKGDRAGAQAIADAAGVPCANVCGDLSLLQSAALLRACSVLVTNDSGPMHLAVATGTPCVAMFGPTLPERTGPYGPANIVLRAPSLPSGCPCRHRTCKRGDGACLRDIGPARVAAAVLQQLR